MAMKFEAKDAENVENGTSRPYLRHKIWGKFHG